MPPKPRPTTSTLVCTRCAIEKPADQYRKKSRRCRACESALQTERNNANKAHVLAYAKNRQARLREQHADGVPPIANGAQEWLCSKCQATKPVEAFGKNTNTMSGLQPYRSEE